eukprot:6197485-Pleurochrysis_carterae.AAC.4
MSTLVRRSAHPGGVLASASAHTKSVSSDPALLFDVCWKRGEELPPFTVDNEAAVEFLRAVVDSRVGTRISHSVALTEGVAVQLYKLLCGKDSAAVQSFSQRGILALHVVLASLHRSERVPNAGEKMVKRTAAASHVREKEGSWKLGAGGRHGLCRNDPDLTGIDLPAAKKKLLFNCSMAAWKSGPAAASTSGPSSLSS